MEYLLIIFLLAFFKIAMTAAPEDSSPADFTIDDTHAGHTHQQSASAKSPETTASKAGHDQGRTIIDGHQDQYCSQCSEMCHCTHTISNSYGDAQVDTHGEHLLYSIIAVLITFIIDKDLLVLPVFALSMAAMLVPLLVPPKDVERILDLSAFRIEWTMPPLVKHVRHYIMKTWIQPTFMEMGTQTDAHVMPVYANQDTSTIAPMLEDVHSQTLQCLSRLSMSSQRLRQRHQLMRSTTPRLSPSSKSSSKLQTSIRRLQQFLTLRHSHRKPQTRSRSSSILWLLRIIASRM
jgi:hypothetical protein